MKPVDRHFSHRPAAGILAPVPLSELDRDLLENCFQKRPFAWESFVDRYLNLVMYVVQQTALRRRVALQPSDETELVNDVFLTILKDDFAVLRRFAGNCSLATYLTVIARRVVVRKLLRQRRQTASPYMAPPSPT